MVSWERQALAWRAVTVIGIAELGLGVPSRLIYARFQANAMSFFSC